MAKRRLSPILRSGFVTSGYQEPAIALQQVFDRCRWLVRSIDGIGASAYNNYGDLVEMKDQPPLVLSSRDMERLERLLESESYRRLPGMDALRNEIDRATVVAPADVPPGVVTMNSKVRFRDDSSDSQFELTLVYPDAARSPDTVSILAPVGSALLGLSVGQSITWQVPGSRTLSLRILDVSYQPEASGELHR